MKRSAGVQLVLLGSALGLAACDEAPTPLRQQRYASMEDCRRDWGDPQDCTASPTTGHGAGTGFMYFGPRYYWDSGRNAPVTMNPDGSTRFAPSRVTAAGSTLGETRAVGSITRGGFGSSAHGFGGG